MTAARGRGGALCGRFFARRRPDDVEKGSTVPSPGCESSEYAGGNHDRPGARGLRPPGSRVASIVAVGPSRRLWRLRDGRISDSPQRSAVASDAGTLIALAPRLALAAGRRHLDPNEQASGRRGAHDEAWCGSADQHRRDRQELDPIAVSGHANGRRRTGLGIEAAHTIFVSK